MTTTTTLHTSPSTTHTPSRKRRLGVIGALGVSVAVLTGCANAGEGAFSGAALGSLAGLAIGSLSGDAGTGAAIGAIAGAAGGAVIGDANERADRRARHVPRHDHYERPRYSDDW